jgi:hypothetical protein
MKWQQVNFGEEHKFTDSVTILKCGNVESNIANFQWKAQLQIKEYVINILHNSNMWHF